MPALRAFGMPGTLCSEDVRSEIAVVPVAASSQEDCSTKSSSIVLDGSIDSNISRYCSRSDCSFDSETFSRYCSRSDCSFDSKTFSSGIVDSRPTKYIQREIKQSVGCCVWYSMSFQKDDWEFAASSACCEVRWIRSAFYTD
jgi:hypothetical protein